MSTHSPTSPPTESISEKYSRILDSLPIFPTIVVEGPDGAGKSTFIQHLLQRFPDYTLASRVVSSDGSTIEGDDWEYRATHPPRHWTVYDRHPVIGEPIYSALFRPEKPARRTVPGVLIPNTLVVFLLVDPEEIRRRMEAEPVLQIEGLDDHLEELCRMYRAAAYTWPGARLIVENGQVRG